MRHLSTLDNISALLFKAQRAVYDDFVGGDEQIQLGSAIFAPSFKVLFRCRKAIASHDLRDRSQSWFPILPRNDVWTRPLQGRVMQFRLVSSVNTYVPCSNVVCSPSQ